MGKVHPRILRSSFRFIYFFNMNVNRNVCCAHFFLNAFYLVEINPVFNENPCKSFTVPHKIMIKTKFED